MDVEENREMELAVVVKAIYGVKIFIFCVNQTFLDGRVATM